MDTLMVLVIAAIIAAIILVEFNKQQQSKLSSNIYNNDKQQLYLFTIAEYKINDLEKYLQLSNIASSNNPAALNVNHELEELILGFNSGTIQLNDLNTRLDHLLNVLNINTNALAQAC